MSVELELLFTGGIGFAREGLFCIIDFKQMKVEKCLQALNLPPGVCFIVLNESTCVL